MRLAPASPGGRPDSAWESAGKAETAAGCDACRRGDFFACQTFTATTGITYDGGCAEYMVARAEALARAPDELSPVGAAPLMCAGVTTFNCLRNSGARPGELVAVLGLGGLGHLGVQFAAKAGFPDGGDRARQGQGASGPRARRPALYR